MATSDDQRQDMLKSVSEDFVRCAKEPTGTHWLKKDEILTDSYGAEVVRKSFPGATATECGDLVRFQDIEGDPHSTVDGVRESCREKWGFTPQLSPNHLAGIALYPDTGDVSGQGITFGSGEGLVDIGVDNAPTTRPDTRDGAGVTVGCFDTGIGDHRFLGGGYLAMPADRVVLDQDPTKDLSGHGTFITGLILQQAPAARVLVKKVLNPAGFTDSFQLACAIHAMADEGIDVLNLSLGLYTHNNEPPLALRLALAYLGARTTVVAAAGSRNMHDDAGSASGVRPFWPAAFGDVIAVGAAERIRDGQKAKPAGFSNHGPWVDVWARGVGLASTFVPVGNKTNNWARWSGTSFSAAVVSGAIAATMTREGGIPAREAAKRLLDPQGGRSLVAPHGPSRPVLDLWPTPEVKALDSGADSSTDS